MYNPETFLTKELLIEVLENYNWDENYTIHEDDCTVDGIKVRFPKCILYFREGFESEMSLYLANPLLDKPKYWSSFDLITYVFAPIYKKIKDFKEPKYIDDPDSFASESKVIIGINNLCIAAQTYLKSCISGDFSWTDTIKDSKSNS